MVMINQLSAVDSLAAGDALPAFIQNQGDTRRASLSVLVAYLANAFTTLTASSYIKVTPVTVANLPNAATAKQGARAFVTDATSATFNAAVVGGGANVVPVFSDGTGWKVG